MQPLVKGALAVAALAVASALAPAALRGRAAQPREATSTATDLLKMPCGSREIPEGDACVPVPEPAESAALEPDEQPTGDAPARLPRRPDRPAKVGDLLLPIAGDPPQLAAPGALDADDRSVLALGAPRGTPAHAIALEGQDGPYEVLGVERLAGRGLVVAALARTAAKSADAKRPRKKKSVEGREAESFVVLFGSLDGAGPGLEKGAKLIDGAVVGFAGEASSNGEPGLRFEARRLRPGTDPNATPLTRLVTDAESIATDARNVLPPRTQPPAKTADRPSDAKKP